MVYINNKIKILNDFSYYLLIIKNYSKNTIYGYCEDLKKFFDFIIYYNNLNVDIEDISIFILSNVTEQDIFSFLIYIAQYKSNGSSTRRRALSALRTFYKWLYTKHYSFFMNKTNPTKNIGKIETTKTIPKYLNYEEAIKVQSIFTKANSTQYIRNNTIMVLFLNTGIRLSELIGIDIDDINFNNKTIRIIAKGNKERIVYLNAKAKNQIEKYLNTRNDNYKPLFLNTKKQRLNRTGVENVCKQAFKLAGISNKGYTVHTLRHTVATYLYKSTKDILIVKEVLGHSTIVSTQIYTHIFDETIKNAVDNNPLNKI